MGRTSVGRSAQSTGYARDAERPRGPRTGASRFGGMFAKRLAAAADVAQEIDAAIEGDYRTSL
jgi:hypothetical protein